MSVDWLAVEGAYRMGQMSLRAMGTEFGTSEGTIRRIAKKNGWVQDLPKTKRRIVADALAGVTRDSTQSVMRQVEDAASQDIADMRLGMKGARAILQSAVDSISLQGMHETVDGKRLELIIEPKDLKILSECIKINIDTLRTIRGLNEPGAGAESFEVEAVRVTEMLRAKIGMQG